MKCRLKAIPWGTYNGFPSPWISLSPCWPWMPLVQPPHPFPNTHLLLSVCLGGAITQPLWALVFLAGFSLQVNHFSALPLFFLCCLIIFHCGLFLLLSELPGNGTKKPWETLLRNQARSHRDICRGKHSPYQQPARMQTEKQTQINRLSPFSTYPHRQRP